MNERSHYTFRSGRRERRSRRGGGARTSRVRHLTPLIRRRPSGTRKSRTGSVTSPATRPARGRAVSDQRTTRSKGRERSLARVAAFPRHVQKRETYSRGHARPTRTGRSRLREAEVQSLRGQSWSARGFHKPTLFSLFSYTSSRKCDILGKMQSCARRNILIVAVQLESSIRLLCMQNVINDEYLRDPPREEGGLNIPLTKLRRKIEREQERTRSRDVFPGEFPFLQTARDYC